MKNKDILYWIKRRIEKKNIDKIDNKYIEKIAEKVLKKTNTFSKIPKYSFNIALSTIRIGDLLNKIDISLFEKESIKEYSEGKGGTGVLFITKDEDLMDRLGSNKIIIINKNSIYKSQRYAMAYLVGAYLFEYRHHMTEYRCTYNDFRYTNNENEELDKIMKRFARALLMPRKLFIKEFIYCTECFHSENAMLENMSINFGVTRYQIIQRMRDLKKWEIFKWKN